MPYTLKSYRIARKEKMDFGPFALNVGNIYWGMKKYKLAERWYLKSLKEEKRKTAWSYANIILFYKKIGKYKEAV